MSGKWTGDKVPVYFLRANETDIVKIGYTGSQEIWRRVKVIQSHSPIKLGLIPYFTDGTKDTEKSLHKKFKEYRLHGEWFDYCGELVEFVRHHREFQQESLLKRLKEADEKEDAKTNG